MIIDWIAYFLKVMACQACFLLIYKILINTAGRHQWSRYYLLITLGLSVIAPGLQLQVHAKEASPLSILEEEVVAPVEQALSEVVIEPRSQSELLHFLGEPQILIFGYAAIVILLFIRFIMNLKVIFTQIKKLPYDKQHGVKIYETSDLAVFSFFQAVFIPRELKARTGYQQIIAHELAHARHWHSLDRLLTDFIIAFLWFNPFIYGYRNALKAVHEFQADETVLRQYPDKLSYQEILYQQLHLSTHQMVSHFNTSIVKKRIVMMNQKRNSIQRTLPLLAVPIVLLLSLAFSVKEVHEPVKEVLDQHLNLVPMAPLLPELHLPKQSAKPEILPIDKNKLERMSSAFGMRKDPRSGERRHHHGIDFIAPVGTEVYATADGVVTTAENRPKGFGTLVEITHGETGEFMTRYAHLDSFVVKKGQKVKKGEVIARVGSSGWSTGPHLHYEVRLKGKAVDPEKYILDYEF